MKTKILIVTLVAFVTIVFAAAVFPYNNAKPPRLSLSDAYSYAITALGSATNQFHCVSATIETTFSADGEWFFTFYSTNSNPKWVSVEFDGKSHVENIMLR